MCSGSAGRRSRCRPVTSSTSRRRRRRPGTRPAASRLAQTAISYAAYRLLVWRASYGANLDRAFALPHRAAPRRSASHPISRARPAARRPSSAIASVPPRSRPAGTTARNEALHYADPSYTPLNAPLVVGVRRLDGARRDVLAAAGARRRKPPRAAARVPADVQTFENSQWGRVRTFAPRVKAAAPDLGDPSSAAYKQAAVAAIRATSQAGAPAVCRRIADRLEPDRRVAAVAGRRRRTSRARRPARSRAERRAERRGRLRLGREARVPVTAADLDDPVPRLQQPAAARARPDQARRRRSSSSCAPAAGCRAHAGARSPRRPRRPAGLPVTVRSPTRRARCSRRSPAARSPRRPPGPRHRVSTAAPSSRAMSPQAAPSARRSASSCRASSRADVQLGRGVQSPSTLLQRLQTPTAGTVIGALLILLGGIVYVSGSPSVGTFFALAGFGFILKYRVLPARRDRQK